MNVMYKAWNFAIVYFFVGNESNSYAGQVLGDKSFPSDELSCQLWMPHKYRRTRILSGE